MKKLFLCSLFLVSNVWAQQTAQGGLYAKKADNILEGSHHKSVNAGPIEPEIYFEDAELTSFIKHQNVIESALYFLGEGSHIKTEDTVLDGSYKTKENNIFVDEPSIVERFFNAGLNFNESLDEEGNTFLILLIKNHGKKDIVEAVARTLIHDAEPTIANNNGECSEELAEPGFFDRVTDFMLSQATRE